MVKTKRNYFTKRSSFKAKNAINCKLYTLFTFILISWEVQLHLSVLSLSKKYNEEQKTISKNSLNINI